MTFGQIKARALELARENPEDMPLFDGLVGAYVNEGYTTCSSAPCAPAPAPCSNCRTTAKTAASPTCAPCRA